MNPADLKYDKEHAWVRVEGDIAVVGISDFAQQQLGEIVYVDLPAEGAAMEAGDTFGEVESVKSVSDLFSPLSGAVVKVNDALGSAPEAINSDPYGNGWLIEVRFSDASELEDLLSAADYEAFVASGN